MIKKKHLKKDDFSITEYNIDYYLNILKMCENQIVTEFSKTIKIPLPQIISPENDMLEEVIYYLSFDVKKHRPKNSIIQNTKLYIQPFEKNLEITAKCDYVEQKINPVRKSDRVY